MFLNKFENHSLNFKPFPPLISGLNPKFAYTTLCVINRSLAGQNFALKSYLYQKLSRKTFGGSARPPSPLDQKGLSNGQTESMMIEKVVEHI